MLIAMLSAVEALALELAPVRVNSAGSLADVAASGPS